MAQAISPEQAAKQQAKIRPPQATVQVEEAPKSAAAGTHPAAPIESDPKVLAEWQGADRVGNPPQVGRWSQTAYGQPVFIREDPPTGGGRRSRVDVTEIPETREQREAQEKEEAKTSSASGRRG